MTFERPELTLERLLHALERELLDAPEDEILAAAHELGMNPSMRASAAFIGVKFLFDRRTTHFGTAADNGAPLHTQSEPGTSTVPKANAPRSE